MKKIILLSLILFNFVLSYYIYYWSFTDQADPFLSDEQALESGLRMLKTTVPAYAVSSVVIVSLTYWLLSKHR